MIEYASLDRLRDHARQQDQSFIKLLIIGNPIITISMKQLYQADQNQLLDLNGVGLKKRIHQAEAIMTQNTREISDIGESVQGTYFLQRLLNC